MASDKKIPPHQILVNSLQSWATLYNVQSDPYISGLTAAVAARKNLPMWASLEPLEYLPHAQINTHKRPHLLSLIMSVLRNSLVFLPVALTWYAISKATSAFALYTAFLDPAQLDKRVAELPEGSRYLIKHSVTKIEVLIEEIKEAIKSAPTT